MTRPPLASLAITVITEITAPLVSCSEVSYDIVTDQALSYYTISFIERAVMPGDNEEQRTSTLHLQ